MRKNSRVEHSIKDWRRIKFSRSIVETYFFPIFKNQEKQNITKSVLEDNQVYSGIWNVKPKLSISVFTKFYCLLCLSLMSQNIFLYKSLPLTVEVGYIECISYLYRSAFLIIINAICLYGKINCNNTHFRHKNIYYMTNPATTICYTIVLMCFELN